MPHISYKRQLPAVHVNYFQFTSFTTSWVL